MMRGSVSAQNQKQTGEGLREQRERTAEIIDEMEEKK